MGPIKYVSVLLFFCLMDCASFGSGAAGKRLQRMQNSPNYKEGVFTNEIETQSLTMNRFRIAIKFFFGGDSRRSPERAPAIIKLKAIDLATPPPSGFRITWLGHATIFLEIGAKTILIDPVFSKRASPYQWIGPKRFHQAPIEIEDLPKIDVVLISHDHYDHLDHGSIQKLKEKTEIFVAPLGVGAHLEGWGIQIEKIREFDWWQKFRLGRVELISTPARHFSGRGFFDRNKTLWSSWVIRYNKNSIYYSGDSGPMPAFDKIGEKYGPFDLTIIQLGAYGEFWPYIHMTPEEAMTAHQQLKGKLLLPVHWGTFDLALHAWDEPLIRTKRAAKTQNIRYLLPRPGQRIVIHGNQYFPKTFPEFELEQDETAQDETAQDETAQDKTVQDDIAQD